MNIRIEDAADVCRIDIEGTIGLPEALQFDDPDSRVATYERFRDALRRIGAIEAPEILVEIRSTGGDVNDALLIHDALCGLGVRITTRCHGYTASAATLIAQAASEGCREISASALYLIHDAVCAVEGNAAELSGSLDLLRRTDERIAALYAARSGRPAAEFEALMAENNGAGRWLSPEEAVAAGLADRIVGAAEPAGLRAVRNLVRGWRRLFAGAGRPEQAARTCCRNVLHPALPFLPERPEPEAASAAAGSAAAGSASSSAVSAATAGRSADAPDPRDRIAPTRTQPREDPLFGEIVPTANQRAYAEDAKRLRGE